MIPRGLINGWTVIYDTLTAMRSPFGLAAARLRVLRAMRRFHRRLAERVIDDAPLTESEQRRGQELATERGWESAVRRLRSR
jgi:hypothetical protein